MRYRGPYHFTRHFCGDDQVAAFDGRDAGGDEFEAAQQIDAITEIEHSVRKAPGIKRIQAAHRRRLVLS